MKPIADFALQPIFDARDEDVFKSYLVYQGHVTNVKVDGLNLLYQFACGRNYVLFSSYDSPYDNQEVLYIHYLDARLQLLDKLTREHEFTAGLIAELRLTGECQLQFKLAGSDTWLQLTVLSTPRRLPPIGIFDLINRPLNKALSKRYLQLNEVAARRSRTA